MNLVELRSGEWINTNCVARLLIAWKPVEWEQRLNNIQSYIHVDRFEPVVEVSFTTSHVTTMVSRSREEAEKWLGILGVSAPQPPEKPQPRMIWKEDAAANSGTA